MIPQGFFKIQAQPKPGSRQIALATLAGKNPSQKQQESETWSTFLKDLARVYRDIFGRAPWHEYLRCTQNKDHPLMGIEEVFGAEKGAHQPLWQLEAETPTQEYLCSACSQVGIQHALTPEYPNTTLILSLKKAFRRSLTGAFLWETPDKLFGFAYGWQAPFQEVWHQSIQPILKKEPLPPQFEALGLSKEQDVFYFAEWGIRQGHGDVGDSLAMIRQLFETLLIDQALPTETPVVGYTRSRTIAHRLFLGLGGQDLFETQPGETVVSTVRLDTIVDHLRGLTPLQFAVLGRRPKKP